FICHPNEVWRPFIGLSNGTGRFVDRRQDRRRYRRVYTAGLPGGIMTKVSALVVMGACIFGYVVGRVVDPPRLRIALAPTPPSPAPPEDGKLRIIVFGAHPD